MYIKQRKNRINATTKASLDKYCNELTEIRKRSEKRKISNSVGDKRTKLKLQNRGEKDSEVVVLLKTITTDPTNTHTKDDGISKQTNVANSLRATAVAMEEAMNNMPNRNDLSERNIIVHPLVHTPKPVKVTATDKYGRKGNAHLSQQVKDPTEQKENVPPYAAVESTPPEAKVKQPAKFDASKSHDQDKKPCVKFVCDFGDNTPKDWKGGPPVKYEWSFGDGTPTQTTKEPTVQHPYAKPGTYPVSVIVTDEDGLTGRAECNQRVREPDIEDPFAHVSNNPKYAEPKGIVLIIWLTTIFVINFFFFGV